VSTLAINAIVAPAKNAEATKFYKKYAIIPFPDEPFSLFNLTKTIEAAYEQARKKQGLG